MKVVSLRLRRHHKLIRTRATWSHCGPDALDLHRSREKVIKLKFYAYSTIARLFACSIEIRICGVTLLLSSQRRRFSNLQKFSCFCLQFKFLAFPSSSESTPSLTATFVNQRQSWQICVIWLIVCHFSAFAANQLWSLNRIDFWELVQLDWLASHFDQFQILGAISLLD